jgi:hypothetical protein
VTTPSAVRLLVAAVVAGTIFAAVAVHVEAQPTVFKIAYYNIQGGNGERPLPGYPSAFTESGNCTDPSRPLNAWGEGIVQQELVTRIGNDPSVVALGLGESWGCAHPAAVQNVLGWPARTSERNGVVLLARYGLAGAETWTQLDTSRNVNPSDTKWVVRAPVCLNTGCTRWTMVHIAHLLAATATIAHIDSYTTLDGQAEQALAFLGTQPPAEPRVLVGDFNAFEGTNVVCTQEPHSRPIALFRQAGYIDAWPAVNGSAEGFTGMWNRQSCGSPEGYLWKRIDYAWSKGINPVATARFGMVTPGYGAPSDHAGLIVSYPMPGLSDTQPPSIAIASPAAGAMIAGSVSVTATVTDNVGVSRVELLVDGAIKEVDATAPFAFSWNAGAIANGPHHLALAATDTSGNRALTPAQAVSVQNPTSPGDETVLHAVEATIAAGKWRLTADASAASGQRLEYPDEGTTSSYPTAYPSNYFEFTFQALAGKPYRVWLRGRAAADDTSSDSVFLQFDRSLNTAGEAVYRIGSAAGMTVPLEECPGCGLQGWAWADSGFPRDVLGAPVYFSTSGIQRLRGQMREDGMAIDQIVISAVTHFFDEPGAVKNDNTILPSTALSGPNLPPTVALTSPPHGATFTAPAAIAVSANASDPDGTVTLVEFRAGSTLVGSDGSAPYGIVWSGVGTGTHVLTARAIDNLGAATTSGTVTVSVTGAPPPTGTIDEIVLHAAAATNIVGDWRFVADPGAASGVRLQNTNFGVPKPATAAAVPVHAFDLTFQAEAGRPYSLWIRGKALNDYYGNDSVFVQFDGTVTAAGAPVSRIGTTSGEPVILEACSGCGVGGWGWTDNVYGGPGTPIYFATTGAQRLRVQSREDGLGIDQIVLSAVRFTTQAPGTPKNDTTILPPTGGGTPPPGGALDEVVLHAAAATNVVGAWTFQPDASAASGVRLQNANFGVAKPATAAAVPAHAFDLTFQAEAGRPYYLWVRGRALDDHYGNDSVFVQFDGSVTAVGAPVSRIGTTSGEAVILEACTGCGVSGWGWTDNVYNGAGTPIYFANTGWQRLRVQSREDGVGIDQIVLSAVRYATQAPGAPKNDATILARTQ